MKRLIIAGFLLALLLIQQAAYADRIIDHPSPSDLPQAEALRIAKAAWEQTHTEDVLSRDAFEEKITLAEKEIDGIARRVWVVTFFWEEQRADDRYIMGYAASVDAGSGDAGSGDAGSGDAGSGDILEQHHDPLWLFHESLREGRPKVCFWTLEEKYTFSQMYGGPVGTPIDVLRVAEDLTMDAAADIAIGVVTQTFCISQEALATYHMDVSLMEETGTESPERLWQISFYNAEPDPDGAHALVYQVNLHASDGKVLFIHPQGELYGSLPATTYYVLARHSYPNVHTPTLLCYPFSAYGHAWEQNAPINRVVSARKLCGA